VGHARRGPPWAAHCDIENQKGAAITAAQIVFSSLFSGLGVI